MLYPNHHTLEGLLRFELMKTNPELVAKFDEENRKREDDYLLSILGPEGSITRTRDGVVMLHSPNLVRKPVTPPSRPIPSTPVPSKPPPAPKPSDYGELVLANFRRRETWQPTATWTEKRRDLMFYIERNRRAQVALAAAEVASLELGMEVPEVRAWSGHEKEAEKKAGWVWGNKYEINVCLNTENCRSIAVTAAHETKHIQQFTRFPNLTSEERERDAEQYGKDFEQQVFGA